MPENNNTATPLLRFIKSAYSKTSDALAASSTQEGTIVFDRAHGMICVDGRSYGGIVDASFVSKVLNITKGDGTVITVDLTDVPTASEINERFTKLYLNTVGDTGSGGFPDYQDTNNPNSVLTKDEYVLLTVEPNGWNQIYMYYYTKSGNNYVQNSVSPGGIAPTFVANTYYKKSVMTMVDADKALSKRIEEVASGASAGIESLDKAGYEQATVTSGSGTSTLKIKNIQEIDGIISIPKTNDVDDSYDVEIDGVYNASTNKIATVATTKTSAAIEVNVPVGEYKTGTTIPAGASLQTILETMLTKVYDVAKTDPTISISTSTSKTYECGETLGSVSLSATYVDGKYTPGDSNYTSAKFIEHNGSNPLNAGTGLVGGRYRYVIKNGSGTNYSEVVNGETTESGGAITLSENIIQLVKGTVSARCYVNTSAGSATPKKSNGEASANLITAKTNMTSNTIEWNVKNKFYYIVYANGSTPDFEAFVNAEGVGFSNTKGVYWIGSSITLPTVPSGSWIALIARRGVTYSLKQMNIEASGSFNEIDSFNKASTGYEFVVKAISCATDTQFTNFTITDPNS